MIFKWDRFFSAKTGSAQLKAIFIADTAGSEMRPLDSIKAIKERGLADDRYLKKTGYWDPVEGCQVTLISEHDLKLAKRGNALNFDNGSHRRNLVVSGLKTSSLEGQTFQIGSAVFCYEKPRPPCGYLNKIEGRGMAYALSYNSGICIQVLRSGSLSVGDKIIMLHNDQPE